MANNYISDDEPEELFDDVVIDLSKALAKVEKDLESNRGDIKILKIGDNTFTMKDNLSALALSRIATASAENRVDVLIEGLASLVDKEDRFAFVDFIEDTELSMDALDIITETMLETITGKG